jgi:cellulase (glycosyl hydrolase family 5)
VFDALGPAPPSDRDLDAIKGWGFNAVRVWAHWHEPIYAGDGALTADGRRRLATLVDRLAARGLALELVLLRPGQLPGQPYHVFDSPAARVRAVRAIAEALRDRRDVLFDLYNEHDHPDGPIAHADLRALRDAVKAADGARVVTVSSTATHLISPEGKIGDAEAANIREESDLVDVLAPHLPRTEDWAAATAARVRALRAVLDAHGRRIPIYLSEERRAEAGSPLVADAYRGALAQARDAGAAGWVFHTTAGYDLRKHAFVDALSVQERAAAERIRK